MLYLYLLHLINRLFSMVFVNEDFAVDESFENFIAQNMRIETIYRQSYDPSIRFSLSTPHSDSPRPNTSLPDLYVEPLDSTRVDSQFCVM